MDRAGTNELLTSALESGTGELLTSPRRPWRPVLRSFARACSHVWLWRQLTGHGGPVLELANHGGPAFGAR
jgi:hypothetical protein